MPTENVRRRDPDRDGAPERVRHAPNLRWARPAPGMQSFFLVKLSQIFAIARSRAGGPAMGLYCTAGLHVLLSGARLLQRGSG